MGRWRELGAARELFAGAVYGCTVGGCRLLRVAGKGAGRGLAGEGKPAAGLARCLQAGDVGSHCWTLGAGHVCRG